MKAELKSTYLTQLDKKRLTMCKQELVGKLSTILITFLYISINLCLLLPQYLCKMNNKPHRPPIIIHFNHIADLNCFGY